MAEKMKVLFAASEMSPLAKAGGLGDVIGSLPKALRKIGVDARVIIPEYGITKTTRKDLKTEFLANFSVKIGKQTERASLFGIRFAGVGVFLVANEKYLAGPDIYFSSTAFASRFDEIKRFLFFSAAVREILRKNLLPFKPSVIHANDWHAGALVSFIKADALPFKTAFSIHNLGNQGKWKAEEVEEFLGEKGLFRRFGGDNNFMAEGILKADAVCTVSPTYAKEILTKRRGEGLENILRRRKNALVGILNGVDYDFFNPAKDDFLFKKYSAKNLEAKSENKTAFQKFYGLRVGRDIPLFGLVSRLTEQKGIHFVSDLCGYFVEKYGCQFAFLGKGEEKYEKELAELAEKYPENVFSKIGFDEELARRIYAGADFFLMPSIFEPCGLGQMISLKYGTIPIVRATGGLKDTIKNGKNGFSFAAPNAAALREAMLAAVKLFSDEKKLAMTRRRCAAENFGWGKSAEKYKRLYASLARSLK